MPRPAGDRQVAGKASGIAGFLASAPDCMSTVASKVTPTCNLACPAPARVPDLDEKAHGRTTFQAPSLFAALTTDKEHKLYDAVLLYSQEGGFPEKHLAW